jgi:hypothetical protein
MYNLQIGLAIPRVRELTTGVCSGCSISGSEIPYPENLSICNLTIYEYMRLFLPKLIFLFDVKDLFLICNCNGTGVPIYTACLHTVLNVLSCVAFTLLVHTYLCTILPIVYTAVHSSLCTTFFGSS